jgi:hypothetical protein
MDAALDISAIVSMVGAVATIAGVVFALVKLLPELKKTQAETYSQIADASESIATGAKVSNEFLRDQIKDLAALRLKDIADRQKEKEETAIIIDELKRQQIATDKLVAEQRREIVKWKEQAEKWQDYANRLSHQVISLRGTPVPLDVTEDSFEDKELE